jgi:hypothetical protein
MENLPNKKYEAGWDYFDKIDRIKYGSGSSLNQSS